MRKKVTAFFLCLIIIFSFSACTKKAGNLVALGDSVAFGFGVEPDDAYPAILYEILRKDGTVGAYMNLAENGITSSVLLESLHNMDKENLDALRNASVITLNIGGNDVLLPFLAHLPEMAPAILEVLSFITEARPTLSELMDFAAEMQELFGNFSVTDIFKLFSFMNRATEVMGNAEELLASLNALEIMGLLTLLTGTLSEGLTEELNKGTENFSNKFEKIIEWIEDTAPNAAVIVNTVYNPIPKNMFDMDLDISAEAEIYIGKINEIIIDKSTGRYLVADVGARFGRQANILDIMNFEFDGARMFLNLDMIHPNRRGHEIIADLIREVINL
jgi:lysophospholipase L1-like esterase